jgi:anti-sigma factor RsiW
MSDSLYKALLEASWRRDLTPEEKARLQDYLTTHPGAQTDWEEETALNFHLERLPDAPLSSNFTARVLQAVELEEVREARERSFSFLPSWSRRWIKRYLPHAASAMLVFLLLAVGIQQYRVYNRKQVADSVEKFYSITAVFAKPEVFQDFEVIHQLGQVQPVNDEELLAALQ